MHMILQLFPYRYTYVLFFIWGKDNILNSMFVLLYSDLMNIL